MIIKKKQQLGVDGAHDEVFPFDDELQYKFYRELPDLSRFVSEQSSHSAGISSSENELDEMNKKMLKSQSKD